jgi:hypothetical protein
MIGGTIPEEITNLTSLENLDLNRNELEGPIPRGIKDLPVLSSLNLSMNRFNFHDLEPFIGNSLSNFYYGFQAPLGLRLNQLNQSTGDDLDVDITLLTNHPCMAEKNQYQWWKDGFYLTPYSDSPVLNLTGLDTTAAGGYICTMTHVDFPDLILVTDTLYLVIDDPVDIILSPDTIDENSPSGSLVGMLTAIESGQIGGHEFSLTPFNGIVDEDNELFMVQLDSLFISVSPDFEINNEYQIFVTATNQNHRTFGKALFVYINDIQEPATNTLTHRPTGRARLFPNPFNDYIMIELASPESGPVQVELLDLQGKLLQSRQYGVLKSVGELKMRLSIDPALPSGIYLISLSFGNLRERLKVIKE